MDMSIGTLSKAAGIKIPTIRYYEEVGLLPQVRRDSANRRRYGQEALDRLRFIRHAREMGFETKAIRELIRISVDPHGSCHEADGIAHAHLIEVRRRITQLRALENELQRMISECRHGGVVDCRIISTLSGNYRAPVAYNS